MEAVPRKTTIREVAQAASVGIGTISRVAQFQLPGKPGTLLRESLRPSGVWDSAPMRRPAGFSATRRNGMLSLSNRDFLHPFHARILQGVESYATGLKTARAVRRAALLPENTSRLGSTCLRFFKSMA